MKRKPTRKAAGELRSWTKLFKAATPAVVALCRVIMLIFGLMD